jgi:ferredoxin, 2Fe-2S
MPKITFNPGNKKVEVRQGETILRAASRARIFIPQRCGGKGSCTMCKIHVKADSQVSSPKEVEKRMIGDLNLTGGMRLACQARVQGEVCVELPENKLKAAVRAQLERQGQEDE